MAQIIVSPAEQRAFANALDDLVRELRNRENDVASRFSTLQKSWQDEQARRFGRSQEDMALYLKAFYSRSAQYAEYLRAHARLGDQYLDCGR